LQGTARPPLHTLHCLNGKRSAQAVNEAMAGGVRDQCTTTELFVAGKRQAFRNLNGWTQQVEPESDEALDLAHIEKFSAVAPEQRIVRQS
jgi:hypothetical protein